MRRVRPFRRGRAPSFRTPSGPYRNDVLVARYGASALLVVAAVALPSCGGSKNGGAPTTAPATAPAPLATTTAPQPAEAAAPSPLTPEARSAATGDIPDNQVFLEFRDAAGYAMKYPEGWAQQGNGPRITFRDKNNIVRVVLSQGARPTPASVKRDVSGVSGTHVASSPQTLTIGGGHAVKVAYTTQSAPNSVTGKRVTLIVDRYYLWRNGKLAVVDLGTPQGVDNVDAYRLMIESFRWR